MFASIEPQPTPPHPACPDRLLTRRAVCSGLSAWALGSAGWALAPGVWAKPTAPAGAAPTSFYANFKGMKLIDQDGKPVAPEQWAHRLVLTNFVYTGCSTVCPVQTRALVELLGRLPAALGSRVRLLSISIDPLNDTPSALRAFAMRMGADLTRWTFATGRPQDVERLSDALRLFRPGTSAAKPEEHTTALWLVDTQGQLRMRYAGNPPDVPRLLNELNTLAQLKA